MNFRLFFELTNSPRNAILMKQIKANSVREQQAHRKSSKSTYWSFFVWLVLNCETCITVKPYEQSLYMQD